VQISVIVMPLESGTGYTARVGEPFNVATEAPTADGAFAAFATAIGPKLPAGAELARVNVPRYDRLFDLVGGLDPDSPAWTAWAAEVDAYRRERDRQDAEPVTSDPSK
jgi:hypothetical protein